MVVIMSFKLLIFYSLLGGSFCVDYVKKIYDSSLFYAAESRNYPEEPNVLFVTCRGGGFKVFNITDSAQFETVSQWTSEAAVEGQDRLGNLLIISELGVGPDGPFPNSNGPKLHLLDVSAPLPSAIEPFATVDLTPHVS
jgi:hypothetical protein